MRAIRFSITIGVFEDDNAISLGTTFLMPTIVHSFRHPNPPRGIRIHIGGIVEHRAGRPDSHLQIIRHLKRSDGNFFCLKRIGVEGFGLSLGNLGRLFIKHKKSHRGRRPPAIPDCSTVIQGHLDLKPLRPFRQSIMNH